MVGRVDAFDPAGHDDLSAQPLGLLQRPARELVPGDAEWEPRVVLDPGRGAGLPARGEGLDQPRLQAFGGAVDRRRQTRRPAAHDHHVVVRPAWRDRQSSDGGDGTHRWGNQPSAVAQHHHRIRAGHGGCTSGACNSGRIVWIQAIVGNLVAVEEAVTAVDSRVEARADYEHHGLERLRGGVSEHLQALQRGGTDRCGDLGVHRGERVEHLDGRLQHPRRLDGPHAGRQRRTERHRDLASELAWESDADHLLDAVHQLRQLGLALDHDRQEPAFALVGHVLPGHEVDVLNGAGKVLQRFLRERREERNHGQLIDSEHDSLTTSSAWRPCSPSNSGNEYRRTIHPWVGVPSIPSGNGPGRVPRCPRSWGGSYGSASLVDRMGVGAPRC